jgi:hypothetical protein
MVPLANQAIQSASLLSRSERVIDKDYLEQLRAQADEIRADLAERESKTRCYCSRSEPVIDPIYLAALRAQADEVRDDFAARQRQLEDDLEVGRDAVMTTTTRNVQPVHHLPMPRNVYKEFRGKQLPFNNNDNSDAEPLSLTDEQIDILADVLAQVRLDFRAQIDDITSALSHRIAVLEGKLDLLTNLLTNLLGNSKSFEASKVIRKVCIP